MSDERQLIRLEVTPEELAWIGTALNLAHGLCHAPSTHPSIAALLKRLADRDQAGVPRCSTQTALSDKIERLVVAIGGSWDELGVIGDSRRRPPT